MYNALHSKPLDIGSLRQMGVRFLKMHRLKSKNDSGTFIDTKSYEFHRSPLSTIYHNSFQLIETNGIGPDMPMSWSEDYYKHKYLIKTMSTNQDKMLDLKMLNAEQLKELDQKIREEHTK